MPNRGLSSFAYWRRVNGGRARVGLGEPASGQPVLDRLTEWLGANGRAPNIFNEASWKRPEYPYELHDLLLAVEVVSPSNPSRDYQAFLTFPWTGVEGRCNAACYRLGALLRDRASGLTRRPTRSTGAALDLPLYSSENHPLQLDPAARVVDIDAHEGAFRIIVEDDTVRNFATLDARVFRQVDIQRVSIRVVCELHGLNPRSGKAL